MIWLVVGRWRLGGGGCACSLGAACLSRVARIVWCCLSGFEFLRGFRYGEVSGKFLEECIISSMLEGLCGR